MRLARLAVLLPVAFTAALVAGTTQAGTVTVSYPPDASFSDAGKTSWDRETTTRDLAQYLQRLGKQYLPEDRTLVVQVLDIDLAGEIRPTHRSLQDLRIARGRADWPKISVRYSLQSNGQVLKSGEEMIADMDYSHHRTDRYASESMSAEKRMLEKWFKTRFVAGE